MKRLGRRLLTPPSLLDNRNLTDVLGANPRRCPSGKMTLEEPHHTPAAKLLLDHNLPKAKLVQMVLNVSSAPVVSSTGAPPHRGN